MVISEIKEYQFDRNMSAYVGTLRNEKVFNIDDFVFVGLDRETIIRCQVVGVEKLPADNPEYKYKLRIPRHIMKTSIYFQDFDGTDREYLTMNCNALFKTVEEAKQSQLNRLENDYRREKDSIEKFFNQFNEKQYVLEHNNTL